MATRAQIEKLLEAGHSFETAARELKISPGAAFMIATGLPADGSGAPPEADGMQSLVNPRQLNPTRKEHVLEWVAERARRELRR
jgi:hypothetical protein